MGKEGGREENDRNTLGFVARARAFNPRTNSWPDDPDPCSPCKDHSVSLGNRHTSGCDYGEGEIWAMELEAVADHAAPITRADGTTVERARKVSRVSS